MSIWPFYMYDLELNRMHMNFKSTNNLLISCHKKYGLYNYYDLGAGFAFANQNH